MATDAEWVRIGRAAAESGMDLSRFVIHRALDWDPLPPECQSAFNIDPPGFVSIDTASSLRRTICCRCSCSNTRSSTPLFDQRFMRM